MQDKLALVARSLLGIVLLVFGLNKMIQFLPAGGFSAEAMNFMGALMSSGYVMMTVAILEIVLGLLLILNRFVPLALVLLAPLSVNYVLFHIFLDPASIGPALAVAVLNMYLGYVHKEKYTGLLSAN